MEKVLGQKDIDALFAQATASEPAMQAGKQAAEKPDRYNFGEAGVISPDQMKSISTVNDLFARNLMHAGGAWLRTNFEVALASAEQIFFSDYLERIPEPAYISSLRLEPIGAVGLLELDLALAAPFVDLLLGGTGLAEPARQLTDIEEQITLSVTEMLVRELNTAWHGVGLQLNFERRETSAQIPRLMPLSEKIICVCFEIRTSHARGALNVCLPAMVLNTMLRRMNAEDKRPRRRSAETRTRIRELLSQVPVGAVLQFPAVRISARELSDLHPGSVLRLPVPRHAAAELRVGGFAFGAARPVRMGEHRGACMESFSGQDLFSKEKSASQGADA